MIETLPFDPADYLYDEEDMALYLAQTPSCLPNPFPL